MIQRYEPPKPRPPIYRITGYFAAVIILIIVAVLYLRPVKAISPVITFKPASSQTSSVKLDWPASGEAAIGAVGYGVLDTSGAQTARPTASTAKLITALTVLKKYPLKSGQNGPIITLTSSDVAIFNKYYTEDGSLVQVKAGEQISEYQMLEAMMIPSANNMADSLATWAFGSLANYRVAARQTLGSLGLDSTKIGSDASGFEPNTVSTAHDLVLLGLAVMQNPVLSQIVGKYQTALPLAGVVTNYNYLLGQDGIVGVKTGNSDQAGGVYVFAAKYAVDSSHNLTVVGAVQGLPSLQAALEAAIPLLNSAEQNFSVVAVVRAGQTVGHYNLPWGGSADAVAEDNLSLVSWSGKPVDAQTKLQAVHGSLPSGSVVGSLGTNSSNSINLILKQKIGSAPLGWRIFRHKL